MDERGTALEDREGAGSTTRPPRPVLGSGEAHHRRRRAAALGAVALLALIVGAATGAGSGGGHHGRTTPTGFFARVQALAGSGPDSFAGQEQAAENAALDRTLTYTPYVRVAGAQRREMALTFDDGPGPYTPSVLSILAERNVPATFFQVGVLQKYFHDSTSEIVSRGYPIGDHTQNHAPMSKLGGGEQKSQVLQQISAMGNYGAPFPRMFRPPYGLWNATTLSILHNYRMLMVLWTIDSEDYRERGATTIVDSVLSGARPGAIVLLHDAGGNRAQTVAALPQIISGLQARGYKLVTVPRLLLDNPPPADQQVPAGLAGAGG